MKNCFINVNMRVILLGQITSNIAYYSFLPFLSFYLTDMNFSAAEIGYLISYRSIANVIGVVIGGILADRMHQQRVMVFCLSITSCIYLILLYISDYSTYCILLTIIGFLSGVSYPCESVLIMNNTTDENRAAIFSILRVIINIAASIAPILAVNVFIKYHALTFIILSLLNIIYVGAILIFFRGHVENMVVNKKISDAILHEINGIKTIFKDYNFLILIIAFTLSTVGTCFIETTLPLYLNIYYLKAEYLYSCILLLNTWMVILLQIPMARFCKFFGYTKSAILGQILVSISIAFLTLINNSVGLVITFIIFTMGEILISPGATLLIVDNCSSNNMGKYLSIGKLRLYLAFPISSSLGGYLLNLKMDRGFLYMYALFALGGACLLLIIMNRINDSSVNILRSKVCDNGEF